MKGGVNITPPPGPVGWGLSPPKMLPRRSAEVAHAGTRCLRHATRARSGSRSRRSATPGSPRPSRAVVRRRPPASRRPDRQPALPRSSQQSMEELHPPHHYPEAPPCSGDAIVPSMAPEHPPSPAFQHPSQRPEARHSPLDQPKEAPAHQCGTRCRHLSSWTRAGKLAAMKVINLL